MRIGIDARMMGAENTRGIGRYIEEMIRGMLVELHEHEMLVLFERNPKSSPIHHPRVEHVLADIPWYGFKEQFRFPRLLRKANLDALWIPHWNIPLFYAGELVVTIHDLLLLNKKKSAKISTRNPIIFYLKYLAFILVLKTALRRAQAIFPPTETIKKEIVAYQPQAKNKLIVTGEGVAHVKKNENRIISEPYLLYVGSAYPHKRIDLLIEAWKRLHTSHSNLYLVIAGEKDIFMKQYLKQMEKEQIPRMKFMGRVSDTDLSSLLSFTEGFVFPTEYEGFGLPPLEALLSGAPVTCSDIPVMREVMPKEGVFFFHKGDVNDMIRAIDSMLLSRREHEYTSRIIKEIRERHSWSRAAKIVLKCLRDLSKEEATHDEKKEKTQRPTHLEKDEYKRRTGAST